MCAKLGNGTPKVFKSVTMFFGLQCATNLAAYNVLKMPQRSAHTTDKLTAIMFANATPSAVFTEGARSSVLTNAGTIAVFTLTSTPSMLAHARTTTLYARISLSLVFTEGLSGIASSGTLRASVFLFPMLTHTRALAFFADDTALGMFTDSFSPALLTIVSESAMLTIFARSFGTTFQAIFATFTKSGYTKTCGSKVFTASRTHKDVTARLHVGWCMMKPDVS